MQQKSKEFFEKLASLQKNMVQKQKSQSHATVMAGFKWMGQNFGIPYVVEDGDFSYNSVDYVELTGRFHKAEDIREEIDK